ncbi:MAG TPA: tetratricopeptide repeat protein [Candidatus Eisenbacteria bacterium]
MRRLPALLLLALATVGAVYEWGGPARRGVRALREGRFEEALRALEAGHADMPDAAVIPYNEGLAHLGKGEADSAAIRFQEAMGLKGDPAREAGAYNLGNLSMRAKEYGRAAGYYKEALRLKPDDLDAKRNLEEALRRMREGRPGRRQEPPSGGAGPPAPGGAQQVMPRPGPGAKEPPPSPRAGEFTQEEAERWLQALESERRARRQEGKARPDEETGYRDW